MISKERLEKALSYLVDTDEPAAQAKALMTRLEDAKKTVQALEYFKSPEGSAAGKTQDALASKAYRDHIELLGNAVADYELLRNKRATETLVVEIWRSVNANQRRGNI